MITGTLGQSSLLIFVVLMAIIIAYFIYELFKIIKYELFKIIKSEVYNTLLNTYKGIYDYETYKRELKERIERFVMPRFKVGDEMKLGKIVKIYQDGVGLKNRIVVFINLNGDLQWIYWNNLKSVLSGEISYWCCSKNWNDELNKYD